jgi:hypothetical protein
MALDVTSMCGLDNTLEKSIMIKRSKRPLIYLNCYLIPYLKNYRKNDNGDIGQFMDNYIVPSRILQFGHMSLI